MNESELAASASAIPRVSGGAAAAFEAAAESLAAGVNARMLAQGGIEQLVGLGNLRLMTDIHRRQSRFLASILADFDPELLVRTVRWAIEAHRAAGFQERFWALQLAAWPSVLLGELDGPVYAEVEPLFNWLNDHIEDFIAISRHKPA